MSDSLIVRSSLKDNFSVLPNHLLNDDRLSADQLGLLVYLLSKPTDWQVQVTELRKRFDVGRDKIRTILACLEQYGYISKEQVRAEGKFATNRYIVSDSPLTEKPLTVKPLTANPTLTKDRSKQRTEYTKSNKGASKQKLLDWMPSEDDKEYAESLELDWQEMLTDIRLWDEKNGNKAAYASCKAFWQGWCRKEAKGSQRRLKRQQSVSGGKRELSDRQKEYAVTVTKRIEKELGHQGYVFQLVYPDIIAFMESAGTYDDWDALGNGLPNPKEKGWM